MSLSKEELMRRMCGVMLLTAYLGTGTHSNAATVSRIDTAMSKKIDAVFRKWNKADSPGCALGVIQANRLIYSRGYGMANLEHALPNSSKTVFRIASTSKQFTAACLVLLAEQQKLSLDDDIREYVPELPDYKHTITIRHLIHHTSGIRDYLTLARLAGLRDADFYTDEEVLERIARQNKLNSKPGDEFLYSNSGYFLLSQIVKRVTGASMREYAKESIFDPLEMNNTHFHDDHRMIVRHRASGYVPRPKGGFQISMTNLEMIGDGGVFTSIDDLVLWDRNFYSPRIGGPQFVRTMLAPGRLNDGTRLDYASGLRLGKYRGLKTVSHGGSFVGFRAQMIRFPEQQVSVVLLANLASFDPDRMAYKVADIVLADHLAPRKSKPKKKKIKKLLTKSDVESFLGSYWDAESRTVHRVVLKKGVLRFGSPKGKKLPLTPLGDNRFLWREFPERVVLEFQPGADGESAILIVEGKSNRVMTSLDPVSLSSEKLSEYVGAYYSSELDTAYSVELNKKQLTLSFPHNHAQRLTPLFLDNFQHDGDLTFEFQRDDQGNVSGFLLFAGRVKNMEFTKR